MKRSMKEALEILGRDSALELEYPREELRHGTSKLKRGDDLTGPEEFSQPPVKRGNTSAAPVKRGRLRRNIAASDSSDDEEGIDAVKRKTGHDPDQLAKGSEEMFAEHTEGEVVVESKAEEEVDLAALEENEDWEALVKAARKQLSDDPINCGRALGRALSSLNRDEEALAAFSSAFEAARDYPDDIERVHIDRGRHFLDRAIAEEDQLKQKHLANEALGDFERAATLGSLHIGEGGEWPDAFARRGTTRAWRLSWRGTRRMLRAHLRRQPRVSCGCWIMKGPTRSYSRRCAVGHWCTPAFVGWRSMRT